MKTISLVTTTTITATLLLRSGVHSFVPPCPLTTSTSTSTTTTTTTFSTFLEARKAKKGTLASLAEDGLLTTTNKVRTPKRSSSTASKKSTTTTGTTTKDTSGISPALAEWMATQGEDDTSTSSTEPTTTTTTTTSTQDGNVATYQAFDEAQDNTNNAKNKSSSRRIKQGERKELEARQQELIGKAVTKFQSTVEESNNNLDDILEAVQGLLEAGRQAQGIISTNPLKTLLSAKGRTNYRLAWVGSDDAICHVGTGLHKVPLARMQEVFWSNLGKNRMEISEIIRILGPFPNVRNILQGTTTQVSFDKMTVVMDSMVDGTGKEILAGKEDNVRKVSLQICLADEKVLVAVVPQEDGSPRDNPLENKGANVLVFVQEPDLDEKLDSLRVS